MPIDQTADSPHSTNVGTMLLPGVERKTTPKALQRFIAWLAVLIGSTVLFLVGAVLIAMLVRGDPLTNTVTVWLGLCMAITAVPLLIWRPSLWARIAGGVTVLASAYTVVAGLVIA